MTLSDYNWRKIWEAVQKFTGKIKLLYSYLDGYMGSPAQVSQIALGIYENTSSLIIVYTYRYFIGYACPIIRIICLLCSNLRKEDYARSILQPGSSEDTSMPRTLVLLNNIAIPRHISGVDDKDRKNIMDSLFQTLKEKVSQNIGYFGEITMRCKRQCQMI